MSSSTMWFDEAEAPEGPCSPPQLPDKWDPNPLEREYFRHAQTGELGWVVGRDGKEMIRLDRGAHEELRVPNDRDWIAKEDVRPITKAELARIAFAADHQYCIAMGLRELARKDWLSLGDEDRRIWLERGPKEPETRRRLYLAITKVLEDIAG